MNASVRLGVAVLVGAAAPTFAEFDTAGRGEATRVATGR